MNNITNSEGFDPGSFNEKVSLLLINVVYDIIHVQIKMTSYPTLTNDDITFGVRSHL